MSDLSDPEIRRMRNNAQRVGDDPGYWLCCRALGLLGKPGLLAYLTKGQAVSVLSRIRDQLEHSDLSPVDRSVSDDQLDKILTDTTFGGALGMTEGYLIAAIVEELVELRSTTNTSRTPPCSTT